MDAKPATSPNDRLGDPDIAFLTASTLAATGRLEEARSTLCPEGQLPSSPQGLDLLARIVLQLGDVEQARKLWQAASQANQAYAPARQALQALNSPWFALAAAKRVAVLLLLGLTASLAVVGLLALFRQLPPPAEPRLIVENRSVRGVPASAPEPPKPIAPIVSSSNSDASEVLKRLAHSYEQRAGQLESQLQILHRKQEDDIAEHSKLLQLTTNLAASNRVLLAQQQAAQNLAERTQRELHSLSEAYASDRHSPTNADAHAVILPSFTLADNDTILTPDGSGWQVRFKSALFDRDDHLKIGAKSQIESVAKAIVRSQQKLHIQIIGYADNEPSTWPWSHALSNSQLGQLRADRVKKILTRLSLFPLTALSATNGAGGALPYPESSRANRTVAFKISPTP